MSTPTVGSKNPSTSQWARETQRSLMISPNLEALLEHDEQSLRANGERWSSSGLGSPTSAKLGAFPESGELAVGLPPPPRPKRAKVPIVPKEEDSTTASLPNFPSNGSNEGSSSSPRGLAHVNPYINPAPSLEEILRAEGQYLLARPVSGVVHGLPSIGELDVLSDSDLTIRKIWPTQESKQNGPSALTWPRYFDDNGLEDGKPTTAVFHPPLRNSATGIGLTSRPRVETIINLGKQAFGRLTDGNAHRPQSGSVLTPPNSPVQEHTNPKEPSKLGSRFKRKEKPRSPVDTTSIGASMVANPDQATTTTTTTTTTTSEMEQTGAQQRPFLSHEPRASSPSSFGSTAESSSIRPTSASDARISISSTIYQASSSHSYPYSMYNPPEPTPFRPPGRESSLSNYSQDSYNRHSFIELSSPDQPRFPTLPSPKDGPSRETRHAESRPANTRRPILDHGQNVDDDLRSTTIPASMNFLDLEERAGLIKKSRKLAKVFGQPLGPHALDNQPSRSTPATLSLDLMGENKLAYITSAKNREVSRTGEGPGLVWSPPDETRYSVLNDRRHSSPLSPAEFGISRVQRSQGDTQQTGEAKSNDRPRTRRSASPTSFMDLSDEEGRDHDDNSAISSRPKKIGRRRPSSVSSSLFENLTPEEQAEEERRRKREKLAKLHRFLGSRVPTNLVLGIEDPITLLEFQQPTEVMNKVDKERTSRKKGVRRSSSVSASRTSWLDDTDRIKEDLDDAEKAINVRRAQKMEKVFGVAPPQTLFHTRYAPSPITNILVAKAPIAGYASVSTAAVETTDTASHKNHNRSAYFKQKGKKNSRPGTAESSKQLIPKSQELSDHEEPMTPRAVNPAQRTSLVYTHYQHSLNSLNDILDRDDRESLAELHQYLSNTNGPTLSPLDGALTPTERRASVSSSSIKSERRHSLPARTSMLSLASEYTITSPKAEVSEFETRRRRAAKLTQFFGVDYRDLIRDVLESIEHGLEHEQKRGTLKPDEVEDLRRKLRNLRIKREGIF